MRFRRLKIRRALVHDTAMMYGATVTSGAVQYLTLIIMARTLGPSALGIVVFATTIGSLVTAAIEFGIGPVLIRFRPQLEEHDPDLWSGLVRSMTRIVTCAALFVLVLSGGALVLSSTVSPIAEPARAVAFGAALAAPMALFTYFQTYLQSARRFVSIAALSIAGAGLRLALTVGLVVVGTLTAYSALATYIVVAWIVAAVGWIVTLHSARLRDVSKSQRKRARKLVLPYLRWSMIGRAVVALHGRLDILLLSVMAGARSTGIYGAAFQTAAPIGMFATSVGEVSFPHLVARNDRVENSAVILKWAVWLPLFSLGGVATAIGGAYLLPILLGSGYQSSVAPFAVLAVAFAIQTWLQPVAMLLYASDRHRAAVRIAIGQTIGLAILDVILIPVLGPLGPAVAILITVVASGPAMVIAALRTPPNPVIKPKLGAGVQP